MGVVWALCARPATAQDAITPPASAGSVQSPMATCTPDDPPCGPHAQAPSASIHLLHLISRLPDDTTRVALASPNGLSVLGIGVSYDNRPCPAGEAPSPTCPAVHNHGPVHVSVDLPAGVDLVRTHTKIADMSGSAAQWSCAQQGVRVECDLLAAAGGPAFVLPSGRLAALSLVLRGSGVTAPAAPGTVAAQIGTIGAAVSVPVPGGDLAGTTSAPMDAAGGPQGPGPVVLMTSLPTPRVVGPAETRAVEFDVVNAGGTPARRRGANSALVLTNLIPSAMPPGVRLAGDGWRCTPAARGTCRFMRPLEVGAFTPRLRMQWPMSHDRRGFSARWRVEGAASYSAVAGMVFPPMPQGVDAAGQADLVRAMAGAPGSAQMVPFTFEARLTETDTLAKLAVRASAAKGLTVTPGGTPRVLAVHLQNHGTSFAPRVGVRVGLPRGATARVIDAGWSCTTRGTAATCMSRNGSLRAGATASFRLELGAAATAPASRDRVSLTPLGPSGVARGKAFTVPMSVADPGDPLATPQVWLLRRGAWAHWRDGSVTRIPRGDAFSYRIDLVNRGGHDLQAGDVVTVAQSVGRGMALQSVVGSAGVTCASAGAVRCTYTATQPAAPDTRFAQVTVTVRPNHVMKRADLGPVVSRVVGIPGDERIPVHLEVVDNPDTLRPSQEVTLIPSAGGRGVLTMAVKNTDVVGVGSVSARTTLPRGVSLASLRAPRGWTCTQASGAVSCDYASVVRAGRRTPGLVLQVRAADGPPAVHHLEWVTRGVAISDGSLRRGLKKGRLPVRGGIRIAAVASPSVLGAAPARVTAKGRPVSLDGKESAGNGVSLRYVWAQRCTTPADAAAFADCRRKVTPRARIAHPHVATTRAIIPGVAERTRFVFELTITDGSATRTKVVTVSEAVPQRLRQSAPRASGTTAEVAARQATARRDAAAKARARQERRGSAAAERRSRARQHASDARSRNRGTPRVSVRHGSFIAAKAGETVHLDAVPSGSWSGEVSYEWSQVSGPEAPVHAARARETAITAPEGSGIAVYRVTARAHGHTATGQAVVGVGITASPAFIAVMGPAARAARSGRPYSATIGGVAVQFGRLAVPAASMQAGALPDSLNFSQTKLAIGQLTFNNLSGTLSAAGLELTTGTVQAPSSWDLAPLSINPAQPLMLAFSPPGSTSLSVTGQLVAKDDFAMLPLPSGWSGQTTLTFAGASSTIEATATGGAGGAVTLTGTIATGGDVNATVTANGLVEIGGSPLDLTGTVASSGGAVTSSVTGTLAGPVQLVEGVSVSGVSVTWTPGNANGPVVAGAANIAIQSGQADPVVLAARLSYTGSIDWRMTLTGASGPSWSPLPGLSIDPTDFSGSIGQAKGAWAWDINGTIPTWKVTSVLTLSAISLDLSDQCTAGNGPACPGGDVFLRMGTTAAVSPPIGEAFSASAQAIIGIGSGGGFALQAGVQDLSVGPITIGSPSFTATYGMPDIAVPSTIGAPSFSGAADGGFSLISTGSIRIPGLGSFSQIAANISSKGWSLGGWDPNGVSLGSGNGSQSGAAWGWSTFNSVMSAELPSLGLKQISLQAGSVSVAGAYTVPEWFTKLVGSSPLPAFGTIQLDPSTGFFNAAIQLPESFTRPKMGSSSLGATSLAFNLESNAGGLTVSVSASSTLSTLGMDGAVQAPELTLSLSYDVATTTASATLEFVDEAGWQNAFGVDGLVVNDAAFTLEVNLATMVPGLKLLAAGILPPSVAGPFEVPGQGIPIVVGAELDDVQPCIDVQVGSSAPNAPQVLQVDGGVVSASFFEFIVAPDGCQLSPTSAPIQPGFQMAFDGKVLGVTVDVAAALTLAPTTKFTGSVDVGAFSLGSLQFQETKVAVMMDEAQEINDVSFSGGFSIMGNGISVAGSLDQNKAVTTGSLTMAQQGTFEVAGFSLSQMKIGASVTFGGGQNTVDINASGKMDLLGTDIDIKDFTVDIDNGVPEEVKFDATVQNLGLKDVLTVNGSFDMQYTASSGDFDVNASAVLTTAAGFSIGSEAQPATLDISSKCVAFEGSMAYGSVFTATLAGTIVYQDGCTQQVTNAAGQQVNGAPGDFSFAADNVAITLGDFDATGSVGIGNVGGDAYASLSTQINLSPQANQNYIGIKGEFQSNGNFSFTGRGALDLAGFDLQVGVSASNQGGNIEVSGSASLAIPGGTNVQISGQFSEIDGAPSTTMTASVKPLEISGFNLGNATVTLTQTPSEVGVQAAVDTEFGSSSAGFHVDGAIDIVAQAGQPPLFNAALNAQLQFIGQSFDISATFTDCTSNCTQPGPVVFNIAGNISESGFNFALNASVSSDGSFQAQLTESNSLDSGTIDFGIFELDGSFSYTVTLFVGTSSPYFNLSGSANVDVEGRWPTHSGPWWKFWSGWGWGDWGTVFSGNASVNFNPFQVCVGVMGKNVCA